MLCTDVPEIAGKLKGPSLGVVAWFEHVLLCDGAGTPSSRSVATADDDAYLHVGDLLNQTERNRAKSSVFSFLIWLIEFWLKYIFALC